MAKVRKDSKGNILRTGECERKDGRYSFSYTVDKVRKVIYDSRTQKIIADAVMREVRKGLSQIK